MIVERDDSDNVVAVFSRTVDICIGTGSVESELSMFDSKEYKKESCNPLVLYLWIGSLPKGFTYG